MKTTPRVLLQALLVAILYSGTAMASTVEVGRCKNGFIQFPTIQAAVTSAPEGATVLVCPGIDAEQVTINKTLTLQGKLSGSLLQDNPTSQTSLLNRDSAACGTEVTIRNHSSVM
jgi:pectin methylesterase-like acyl-CoA thioesterase